MGGAEPVRRAAEIEQPSNLYLIHPAAGLVARLCARSGIGPNAVSVAGMAFGTAAGIAYSRCPDRGWVVAGFALMLLWHVMDGADGQLARLTRSQSELGAVLDGVCDYVTFIAVYAGLAASLGPRHGAAAWALAAAAGACHAVQSASYEVQRQDYALWGLGRASAALKQVPAAGGLAGRAHGLYLRVQERAAGIDPAGRLALTAALEQPTDRAAALRAAYRAAFAPRVRRWSVLSANTRTGMIFLSALAQAPLLYFWAEVTVLNAVLAGLLLGQRLRTRQFLRAWGIAGPAA